MCRDWPKQLYMGSRAHMLDMTRTRRLHTPGSNPGTLRGRQIHYLLSYHTISMTGVGGALGCDGAILLQWLHPLRRSDMSVDIQG